MPKNKMVILSEENDKNKENIVGKRQYTVEFSSENYTYLYDSDGNGIRVPLLKNINKGDVVSI